MTEGGMLAFDACAGISVNAGREFRSDDGFLPAEAMAGKTVNIGRRDGLVRDSVRVTGFEAARDGAPALTVEGGQHGPADAYRGEDTMPLAGPVKIVLRDIARGSIHTEVSR